MLLGSGWVFCTATVTDSLGRIVQAIRWLWLSQDNKPQCANHWLLTTSSWGERQRRMGVVEVLISKGGKKSLWTSLPRPPSRADKNKLFPSIRKDTCHQSGFLCDAWTFQVRIYLPLVPTLSGSPLVSSEENRKTCLSLRSDSSRGHLFTFHRKICLKNFWMFFFPSNLHLTPSLIHRLGRGGPTDDSFFVYSTPTIVKYPLLMLALPEVLSRAFRAFLRLTRELRHCHR